MKKIRVLLVSLLFVAIQFHQMVAVSAAEAFTIDHFDMELTVNESGTIEVNQQLNITFSEKRHGIYLNIPTKYQMKWTIDGQDVRKTYRFPVSKIKVANHKYDVESYSNGKQIVIGDEDKYVIGPQNYQVSYTITTRDLDLNGRQRLYYSIVAPEWDTTIDSVSFAIHMPKAFDVNNINFYFGEYGSEQQTMQGFTYEVMDSTIYGNLSTRLLPMEGITILIDLPTGYFTYPEPVDFTFLIVGLSTILAALAIVAFYKFGKDDMVIKTVEFTAPAGLTCASMSYVMDGDIASTDVLSLIMEWANGGYLSIEELDSNNLRLTKEKEMGTERLRYEKRLFQSLFNGKEEVETKKLSEKFYNNIQVAIRDIKRHHSSKEYRVFTKSSLWIQGVSLFFAIVPTFLGTLDSLNQVFYDFGSALLVSICFAGLGLLSIVLWYYAINKRQTKTRGKAFMLFVLAAIISILYVAIFVVVINLGSKSSAILYSSIIATIVISACAFFMDKRTPQGLRWYGQILGLKDFILTAEKDRLEALVLNDPQYFYYILPYAYVLGVSDVWSKKFTDIIMDNAKWYKSDQNVPVLLFMPRYYRTMSSLQQLNALPAVKSSSGGGSFTGGGGGGFSGGGFGGGGGGSW